MPVRVVRVFFQEQANDRLTLNALGGDDNVDATSLEADGIDPSRVVVVRSGVDLAQAETALAFFARADRSAGVRLTQARAPPLRPPLAPSSRKYCRTPRSSSAR